MLICFLDPISAETHGLFTYEVVGNTVSITDYPAGAVGEVVIPSEISGMPVTEIGNWAFYGCYYLTSVTIPDSVTAIGYLAFASCHELTTFTIPRNVASIGFSAFTSCGNLTSILVESGNPGYSSVDGVLFNADMTTLIQCPAGVTGTYLIPDGVTTIGRQAFGNCHTLTSIDIAGSVTAIGDSAFFNCDGLTGMTLPQSVDSIGDRAFEGCRLLTTIAIPEGVRHIGTSAWYGCRALTGIHVDTGNSAYSSMGGVLLNFDRTILLQYPPGLSGSYAIPGGVSTIADHAFWNCKGLITLTIPASVITIGDSAFEDCNGLTALTITDGVTTIGDRAFRDCGELPSVTIPPSIARIGESAFYLCRRLKSALFLGDAPLLGSGAFRNTASQSRTDPGFTIYYLAGSSGFPTPTWDEKPTVSIDLEAHPAAPWLLDHTLPHDSDLDLDMNGDGVSLLMAYALDLDPNANLAGSLPAAQMSPDTMSISFFGARAGIGYTVETSEDMMEWDSAGVTLSEPDASGRRTATVDRDLPKRFLRLVVND